MAKNNGDWKAQKGEEEIRGSNLVVFAKAGDEFTGEFISTEIGRGKYDNALYNVKDLKTQEVKGIFGSAVIDRLFKQGEVEGKIKPGVIIRFVYIGKVKSSAGRNVKNFKLFVRGK